MHHVFRYYKTTQFAFDGDEQTFMAEAVDLKILPTEQPRIIELASEKTKISKTFVLISADAEELRYESISRNLWVVIYRKGVDGNDRN